MSYHFYAMMSRMKYIDRWALMRNSYPENISEHSLEVAMLAHALALVGNRRLGKQLDAGTAALLGMYHDCTEIITGDMPTPVKYHDDSMREAYRKVEEKAAERLLSGLPGDLREDYRNLLLPEEQDPYLTLLVKAADRLSALIKCREEEKAGNREFVKAGIAVEKRLREMKLPEVDIFMQEFLPSYSLTLDELQ